MSLMTDRIRAHRWQSIELRHNGRGPLMREAAEQANVEGADGVRGVHGIF